MEQERQVLHDSDGNLFVTLIVFADCTEVTTTLTDMIIKIISDRANLLDSFVILYATFVAALYKLKGADLGEYHECGTDYQSSSD
jgi:hypothetical protein